MELFLVQAFANCMEDSEKCQKVLWLVFPFGILGFQWFVLRDAGILVRNFSYGFTLHLITKERTHSACHMNASAATSKLTSLALYSQDLSYCICSIVCSSTFLTRGFWEQGQLVQLFCLRVIILDRSERCL